MLQSYEGYMEQGRFIPIGSPVTIQDRCKVIVTVLPEIPGTMDNGLEPTPDENIPDDVAVRLRELDEINLMIGNALDEEMPPIEPIRLREVEL